MSVSYRMHSVSIFLHDCQCLRCSGERTAIVFLLEPLRPSEKCKESVRDWVCKKSGNIKLSDKSKPLGYDCALGDCGQSSRATIVRVRFEDDL